MGDVYIVQYVTPAEAVRFGTAYLTNMHDNALFGIFYNPGQSNNAVNAGNAAVGRPVVQRFGPGTLFGK